MRRNQSASRDRTAEDTEQGECRRGRPEIQKADSSARELEFRLPLRKAAGRCACKPRLFPRKAECSRDRFVAASFPALAEKILFAPRSIRRSLPALRASPCFRGDRRERA